MHRRRHPTSRIDVEYLEAGSRSGPPVLLLHGFPDDATCWSEVFPRLVDAGRYVIAPFVRGCGGSRFINDTTPRAADFAALGNDALEIVDGLDLRELTVVGQDWGSPTSEIVAFSRPERVSRLVKLNWYGVYSMYEMSRARGFNYEQLRALWYVWMLNVPLGEMVLKFDRENLAQTLWREWSPSWDAKTRDAAVRAVARSFASDDWVRVAIAAYRSGISEAEQDPHDDELRRKLAEPAPVRCPTIIMTGANDGVERSPLSKESLERFFPAGVSVDTLSGVGHFPQREDPDAVVRAILGA